MCDKQVVLLCSGGSCLVWASHLEKASTALQDERGRMRCYYTQLLQKGKFSHVSNRSFLPRKQQDGLIRHDT